MLKVKNLHVGYGAIKALHGVSLEVSRGEVVAVIGSNGAGKTTLLKTISGLLKPIEGSVFFNGNDITQFKPDRIVASGICMVPEGRHVFASMSVKENLLMGAHLPQNRKTITTNMDRAIQLFPRLEERLDQKAGTLSGGEQQMLAIARALMGNPVMLLLDEPSLGLAPILVDEVYKIILDIQQTGTAILVVEQNAYQALTFANRGYVIETGNIVTVGRADELLDNAQIKVAYLGE